MAEAKGQHEADLRDNTAVIHDSLNIDSGYEDFRFKKVWKTDIYNNKYQLSADENYFRIIPPVRPRKHQAQEDYFKDFKECAKHHLVYVNNYCTLQERGVETPGFRTGVHDSGDRLELFTIAEKPEGQPLSKLAETVLETNDAVQDTFDRYNTIGRELAGARRIMYPRSRENEDLIVTDEAVGQIVYVNPGTYIDDKTFYTQLMKNSIVPDRQTAGSFTSPLRWDREIRR